MSSNNIGKKTDITINPEDKKFAYSSYLYDAIPSRFLKGKILEIGSGCGISQFFSKYKEIFTSDNYLGIDLFKYDKFYLNIEQYNALEIDYSKRKYDTLLTVAFMEHLSLEYWEELLVGTYNNLNDEGFLVIIVPKNESLFQHLKQDYYTNKRLKSVEYCHKTFSIIAKCFERLLSRKAFYTKTIRSPIPFREEGEFLVRAILRFFKRLVTFHKTLYRRLFNNQKCILVVFKKE